MPFNTLRAGTSRCGVMYIIHQHVNDSCVTCSWWKLVVTQLPRCCDSHSCWQYTEEIFAEKGKTWHSKTTYFVMRIVGIQARSIVQLQFIATMLVRCLWPFGCKVHRADIVRDWSFWFKNPVCNVAVASPKHRLWMRIARENALCKWELCIIRDQIEYSCLTKLRKV